MRYTRVLVDAIGYVLPPVVVTSAEIEARLAPLYRALHLQPGQLEEWTGIVERRWWEPGTPLSRGAIQAGLRALAMSGVAPSELEVLLYGGVCREAFEPATACRVADGIGVSPRAAIFDVSNACLGMLNGMLEIANRIELGQIRAGMVVSCESAREIVELTLSRLVGKPEMERLKLSLATLTGGSGAAAILLTDGSFASPHKRRFLGGAHRAEPAHHALCRWGLDPDAADGDREFMSTDSVAVLKHGVALGAATWRDFLKEMSWSEATIDHVICHQVGSGHQSAILETLGIAAAKDFTTFEYLGNMGTVSLPITAAIAEERHVLEPGDKVAFLGIGSGLNCMMLGLEW